jgi:hypothetical protein
MAVIVANFFMRFAWALTLLPEPQTAGKSFYTSLLFHLGPMVAAGEVVRRMVWGFFRLEWEQLEVFGSPMLERVAIGQQQQASGSADKGHGKATSSAADVPPAAADADGGWVLTAPVVGALAAVVLGAAPLDPAASARTRARFVEAVVFALVVGGIIVYAAMPELRMLLS